MAKRKKRKPLETYKDLIKEIDAAGPTEHEYMLMSIVVMFGRALEEISETAHEGLFHPDLAAFELEQANIYVREFFNEQAFH